MRHCTKSLNVSCHGFVCCFLQQQHFHSLQRSFNPIQFGLFGPFTCNRLTSIKLTINVRNCFWNSPDVKPAAEAIAVKNIFCRANCDYWGGFPVHTHCHPRQVARPLRRAPCSEALNQLHRAQRWGCSLMVQNPRGSGPGRLGKMSWTLTWPSIAKSSILNLEGGFC